MYRDEVVIKAMKRFICWLLVLSSVGLLCWGTTGWVQAQSTKDWLPIRYGQTVRGTLNATHVSALFAFIGRQGDEIGIVLQRQPSQGDWLPFIALVDAEQHYVLAVSLGSSADSAELRYRLPASARYVIRATTSNTLPSDGVFDLTLQWHNPQPMDTSTTWLTRLDTRASYAGHLHNEQPFHIYAVYGQANTTQAFALTTTESLQAGLYLYDALFTARLVTAEHGQPMEFTWPDDRLYFLVVARTASNTQGDYTLSIVGSNVTPSLQVGTVVTGQGNGMELPVSYLLHGSASQDIRLRIATELPTETIMARILDHNGQEIYATTIQHAGWLQMTLPVEGVYVLELRLSGGYVLAMLDPALKLPITLNGYQPLVWDAQTEVKGAITEQVYGQSYYVELNQGERVRWNVIGADGLQPLLIVQDADGNTLAEAQGQPVQLTFDAPYTGSYGLIVSRQGLDNGSSTGTFILSMDILVPPPAFKTLNIEAPSLLAGQRVQGDIGAQIAALYSLEIAEASTIKLNVTADMPLVAMIFDDQLQQIAYGVGGVPDTLLPTQGHYYVLVMRLNGPIDNTIGPYTLSLLNGIASSTTRPTSLEIGEVVQAAITDSEYQQIYQVELDAAQPIHLQMAAARAQQLLPLLIVTDAQGVPVAISDSSQTYPYRAEVVYSAPQAGSYQVIASRLGEALGMTEGAFTLRLDAYQPTPTATPPTATRDPQGALPTTATPSTPDRMPTVLYGKALRGSLTNEQPLRYYQMHGLTGDRLTIRVERLSGSLDPLVYLYDYTDPAQPVLLTGNDNRAEGDLNAQLSDVSLPHTGRYLVVVTRTGATQGTTTGEFILTVTQE